MRPGEAPPRAGAGDGLRIILVPLDGSPGSEAVLAAVRELARVRGAVVRLLHVVAPVATVRADDDRVVAYADQESARIEEETRVYLKRVARELVGVTVQEAVRFGEPAAQIVEEAEAAGADLIALATHRRHGLGRLLKGSVAGRLERATTIPLLLVPYGEPVAA
jgi:nucleotide-binding universal stress UspA family protein